MIDKNIEIQGNGIMKHHEHAKLVIKQQSEALELLSRNIPENFAAAIEHILSHRGRVITCGIGKSGYIARKIAASLASTGTLAFFLHPAEASHGDLGMISGDDIVLMLSNSGETKELFDVMLYCKRHGIPIMSMTSSSSSSLAQNSDFPLILPNAPETSSIGAPTTSALMMLSLGDAIVTSLHESRGFSKGDFLQVHPGGKLGADLSLYSDPAS